MHERRTSTHAYYALALVDAVFSRHRIVRQSRKRNEWNFQQIYLPNKAKWCTFAKKSLPMDNNTNKEEQILIRITGKALAEQQAAAAKQAAEE